MGINANKYRDRYIKRAARVLPAIQPGKSFTPEAIDKIVGGAYSAKFVFYLRELGFEFSQQKDGRKIVSYTLIKEPVDAAAIRASTPSQARGAAKVKTAAPKVKAKTKVSKTLGLTKNEAKKIRDEVSAEKAAEIKAKNLATLKAVAKSRKKNVREFDDVTEQFGTSGEVGTSFSVERDWDSIEGLDLQKLVG